MNKNWPIKSQIGWTVITAGWVDLDIEVKNVGWNYSRLRKLPPGLRMILKHVDSDDMAYCYHDNYGVLRFPVTLLEAWER